MTKPKATKDLKKKRPVGRTQKAAKLLFRVMEEEGLDVAKACRKYPEELPCRFEICAWSRDDPDFKEGLDQAYESWIVGKLEELEYVSTASRLELYPDLDARDAYEARRVRVDTLKFIIGKAAPMLTSRWAPKSAEVNVNAEITGPIINVISYAKTQEEAIKLPQTKTIEGEIANDN